MFGRGINIIYYTNNIHNKNNLHDNDVNNISKWNLLHDILNTYKRIRILFIIIPLPCMYIWIYVELSQSIKLLNLIL